MALWRKRDLLALQHAEVSIAEFEWQVSIDFSFPMSYPLFCKEHSQVHPSAVMHFKTIFWQILENYSIGLLVDTMQMQEILEVVLQGIHLFSPIVKIFHYILGDCVFLAIVPNLELFLKNSGASTSPPKTITIKYCSLHILDSIFFSCYSKIE